MLGSASTVMDVPLLLAGSLALLGAAVHGIGGELLVVRNLSPATLPPSRFGGPRMTRAMIHATWHMTTVAFLTVGAALLLAGAVVERDTAEALALLSAVAATAFAGVAIGAGATATRAPAALLRHPGPLILGGTAALAWWGALAL